MSEKNKLNTSGDPPPLPMAPPPPLPPPMQPPPPPPPPPPIPPLMSMPQMPQPPQHAFFQEMNYEQNAGAAYQNNNNNYPTNPAHGNYGNYGCKDTNSGYQDQVYCDHNSGYGNYPPNSNHHGFDSNYNDPQQQQQFFDPKYNCNGYNYTDYSATYAAQNFYESQPSTSGQQQQRVQYTQLNPTADIKQLDIVIDDSDDWRHCKVCESNFEDEKAYNRHCRGLNHTQKILEREQKAGLIQGDPEQPPEEPMSEALTKKYTIDPEKRDLLPSDVGGATFNEKYFCKHCNCSCSGPEAYDSHLKGKRHTKTLKNKASAGIAVDMSSVANEPVAPQLPSKPAVIEAIDTGCPAVIQSKMDSCSEPLIGLKYVVEYISPLNEARYVCNLCEAKCDPRMIFQHLVGFKHRLRYLKEIRSDIYAEIQLCADNKERQAELLKQRSAEIEAEDGRCEILQRCEMLPNVVNSKSQPAGKKGPANNKKTPVAIPNKPPVQMEINVNSMFRNTPQAKPKDVGKRFNAETIHEMEPHDKWRRSHSRSPRHLRHSRSRSPRYSERSNEFPGKCRSPLLNQLNSYSDDIRSSVSTEKQPAPGNALQKNESGFDTGYYYRERTCSRYDELYIKPYSETQNVDQYVAYGRQPYPVNMGQHQQSAQQNFPFQESPRPHFPVREPAHQNFLLQEPTTGLHFPVQPAHQNFPIQESAHEPIPTPARLMASMLSTSIPMAQPMQKPIANASAATTSSPSSNVLKTLLSALAQTSMMGGNNSEALKMSNLLTNAILKVKQEKLKSTTPAQTSSPIMTSSTNGGGSSASTSSAPKYAMRRVLVGKVDPGSSVEKRHNSAVSPPPPPPPPLPARQPKSKLGSSYYR